MTTIGGHPFLQVGLELEHDISMASLFMLVIAILMSLFVFV